MHCYLVVVGASNGDEAATAVSRALGATLQLVPNIDHRPTPSVKILEPLGGAIGVIAPESDYDPPMVQVETSGSLVALCYGTISGVSEPASHVMATFRQGGIGAVQRLDGSFASVVVDKEVRRIWVASDCIGMRAPRFVASDKSFAVASHDLIHVCAGLVQAEFDLDAVASLVSCDWSIGGRSLLRGIQRFSPWKTIEWSARGVKESTQSPIDAGTRVPVRHERRISLQVEEIVDEMQRATQRLVADRSLIRANLTAGLDSRGVLALLASANPQHLVLSTLGNEASLDVRVARRLARLVGAEHECSMPKPPRGESFAVHNRLRAFALDGMGDARKALSPLPRWNTQRNVLIGGEGGEIFRGFFYQYFASGHVPSEPRLLGETLLKWRFRRALALPFADGRSSDRLRDHLTRTLAELSSLGTCGYDTLDLFYLYERYAQWGSSGERCTWSRRWTPYEVKPAILSAYRLPPPIGTRCTIVPRAVRRYLPLRAYWTPVNGFSFIALEGDGAVRFSLRQALNLQSKLAEKLERRLSPRRRAHGDVRARLLDSDYTRELLSSRDSLATSLFGATGIAKLLDELRLRNRHSDTLAYLLNAEAFRRLTLEAIASTKSERRWVEK